MLPGASSEPASRSNPRRCLVDENVAPLVTAYLRGRGELNSSVRQEENRAITTYDVDFGAIRRLQQVHHGIACIACGTSDPKRSATHLSSFSRSTRIET